MDLDLLDHQYVFKFQRNQAFRYQLLPVVTLGVSQSFLYSALALTQINLCHMIYDSFVCELHLEAIQPHLEVLRTDLSTHEGLKFDN